MDEETKGMRPSVNIINDKYGKSQKKTEYIHSQDSRRYRDDDLSRRQQLDHAYNIDKLKKRQRDEYEDEESEGNLSFIVSDEDLDEEELDPY